MRATAGAAQRQGAMFDPVVMRYRYVNYLPPLGDERIKLGQGGTAGAAIREGAVNDFVGFADPLERRPRMPGLSTRLLARRLAQGLRLLCLSIRRRGAGWNFDGSSTAAPPVPLPGP